jgi:hypothetical protein
MTFKASLHGPNNAANLRTQNRWADKHENGNGTGDDANSNCVPFRIEPSENMLGESSSKATLDEDGMGHCAILKRRNGRSIDKISERHAILVGGMHVSQILSQEF